jgi:hypothetical protein
MLRRRVINLGMNRSRRAPAAGSGPKGGRRLLWALEDRVLWKAADALRGGLDVVRWPFERAAWTVEERVVWPLEERAGGLSAPLRAAGATALATAAIGAGVLGLAWAADGGGSPQSKLAFTPATRIAAPAPDETVAPAAPVLHGAVPDFTPEAGDRASKVGGAEALTAKAKAAPADSGGEGGAPTSSAAASGAVAGPAAIEVAHKFAGAFVHFETGEDGSKVRAVFHRTATPQLAGLLLRRPPRLPANAKVPRAKVLNVVAGPSHGGVYTISVSLLRVGLTSELRLDMQRDRKTHQWQVTDVRG